DELGVKTGSCKVNAARQNLLLLGERQPSEPQPSSSTTPPSHEEQVTNVASQSQKTHTPRRAKRGRDTKIPQSSGPLKKVGDEVVYTGEDDRVGTGSGSGPRCLDTTLEDADAQTRFETASKQSCDPPLSKVNTFGNGEDSMEHQDDLTDFVLPTPYDSPLSGGHTPRSDEGIKLFKIGTSRRKSLDKENVSKQGRNFKTRSMFVEGDFDDTDDMVNEEMENVEGDTINAGGVVNTATTRVSAARASVTTVGVSISTAEPRTPPTTTTTAFEDEDLTIAQTLVKMRSKGIMQEPEKTSKNPRKAQIQMDEELAMRLHEEEKVELERMQRERAAQEEASNPALIAEFDDIQARMDADALLAARLQEEEREQFSIDEQARFLVEIIVERKRFFATQRAEQIKKKPPTKTQLRNKMITFLKNMGRFTYNQLKNKSLEEIQKLGKNDDDKDDAEKEELKACLDIVLGDDIAINVESLATKYLIVNWKTHILTENMIYYQIIRADGSSKNYKIFNEMLHDFNRQDMVDLYSLVKERVAIHMMVEKKYPLTQEMISRMLNRRLEVDYESTMAFELIRFIKAQLEE
ncbi:hypothetical protein Tco_0898370, partial [Tanacetum coccineum]